YNEVGRWKSDPALRKVRCASRSANIFSRTGKAFPFAMPRENAAKGGIVPAFTPPPLPSDDKRWKIVNGTMRKNGFARHALIETLHTVQSSFGYLDDDA